MAGRDVFEITVFGDEPYGNYNRILLSNVLAGSDVDEDARSTSMRSTGTRDNGIDLRAGVRVVRIDRYARLVHADDGTVDTLRQPDPGDRQPVVLPTDDRVVGGRQEFGRRCLRIPYPRRLRRG